MCNNTEKFKEQLCDLSTAFTVGLNAMARELGEYTIEQHQDHDDLAKLRKIEVQLTRVDQDIHSQEGYDPVVCKYVNAEKVFEHFDKKYVKYINGRYEGVDNE